MTNKKMKAHMRNLYKIFIVLLCLILVTTVIPSDVFALRSMAHVNFAGQAAQGENRHGTTGLSRDLSPGHKPQEEVSESIIKFFLEGNEGAALGGLQAKNNGGIEFVSYVRNGLLPAIRRKVDSLSPNELLNIDNILNKLVAQIEDQIIKNEDSPMLIKIINSFLVINIRPFMDKNYKTRVANLLPAHENPALLDMLDRLRVSDNPASFSGVGARLHTSDIIIEADDGKKFKFDIQSFDIDIPEERHYQKEAKPWKAISIKYRYNEKEMAFLDLKIYYEVNEQGKSVLARGVMDYAFSGKDIVAMEVPTNISDDYSGVGTRMMALAVAIAAEAGAANLLVSDVLDNAVAFYEKLYPGEIDPDKKFKFVWRQREGHQYRSRYTLDLNKVVALPGTGRIKKRKLVELSINKTAAEYIRARAITLSLEKPHDNELSRQWDLEEPGPTPEAIKVFIQANREGARAGRQLIRIIVNSGITDADNIRRKLKSLVEDLDEDEIKFFNRQIERILRVNMGSGPAGAALEPRSVPSEAGPGLSSFRGVLTNLRLSMDEMLLYYGAQTNLEARLNEIESAISAIEKSMGVPGAVMSSASKRAILRTYLKNKLLKVSPDTIVPRPFFDNAIERENAERWINAHNPSHKKQAKSILENVTHVNQEQFELALEETIIDFNNRMGSKPYVLMLPLNRGHRSEEWIFRLAQEKGIRPPKEVIVYGENRPEPNSPFEDVLQYCKAIRERIKESGVRDIVFVDDAAYSGNHIVARINELFMESREEMANINIHVLVPFATEHAAERIQQARESEHFRYSVDNIFLYKYRVIQILLDVLGHENKLDFDMDHFLHRVVFINEGFERFLTLTYFQHKVADYASVLRAVGEGKVFAWGRAVTDTIPFIPNTIPPYDVEYSEKIKQKLVELKANMASGPAGTLPRSRPGGPIKEKHDLEQAIRSAA